MHNSKESYKTGQGCYYYIWWYHLVRLTRECRIVSVKIRSCML